MKKCPNHFPSFSSPRVWQDPKVWNQIDCTHAHGYPFPNKKCHLPDMVMINSIDPFGKVEKKRRTRKSGYYSKQ
jgi:hypothetical protein